MLRTFRGGLLIGLAVAVAVAAGAIAYERYDTRTLEADGQARRKSCAASTGACPGFSIPDDKGDWTTWLRRRLLPRRSRPLIFDDPKKAKFIPARGQRALPMSCRTARSTFFPATRLWSMSRETNFDLYFLGGRLL